MITILSNIIKRTACAAMAGGLVVGVGLAAEAPKTTNSALEVVGKKKMDVSFKLTRQSDPVAQNSEKDEGDTHPLLSPDHPIVRLWPIEQVGGEKNRLKQEIEVRSSDKVTYRNIKDPHLTVYQVQSSKPTPAVMYCPGGAYKQVSVSQRYVDWLNGLGFTVFALKYTVPNDRESAFREVQRAMRLVRHNAEKWTLTHPNSAFSVILRVDI